MYRCDIRSKERARQRNDLRRQRNDFSVSNSLKILTEKHLRRQRKLLRRQRKHKSGLRRQRNRGETTA